MALACSTSGSGGVSSRMVTLTDAGGFEQRLRRSIRPAGDALVADDQHARGAVILHDVGDLSPMLSGPATMRPAFNME